MGNGEMEEAYDELIERRAVHLWAQATSGSASKWPLWGELAGDVRHHWRMTAQNDAGWLRGHLRSALAARDEARKLAFEDAADYVQSFWHDATTQELQDRLADDLRRMGLDKAIAGREG